MIARRSVLKWAALGLGAKLAPALAESAPRPVPSDQKPFDRGVVVARARDLAKKPFEPPATTLPGPFANLTYEQYVEIRPRPNAAVWAGENLGFIIEPLPRGFVFTTPVTVNIVENGAARTLAYAPGQFDFGKLSAPDNAEIGYSGFRVLRARSSNDLAELAIFQGASFFRSLAYGQSYGLSARALMIRTGDPRGEEFPFIRESWIERPSMTSDLLVVHALVDSVSMTGAFRFTLRPGDVTIIDTECTLFTRSPADFFGLGGMTGMFLYGNDRRRPVDDVRAAVYEIGGLQVLNGNGEWLWRPVTDPAALQVSVFVDANPRGFGLLQRDRSFAHFQDDDQRWEMRPSLWIEPIGDWGEGSVQLIEIPTESETNENILAFWRPKTVLQPGAEAAFAYRQFWCWTPPDRPNLAVVTETRGGHGSAPKRRRYLVEFSGDLLADPQRGADIKPALSTSAGSVVFVRPFFSRERKTCRVLCELDFGNESLAELRLVLEQEGKPVSETWLYRWTA